VNLKMIFFDVGGTIDLYPKNDQGVIDACGRMQEMLVRGGVSAAGKLAPEAFRSMVLEGLEEYKSWRLKDLEELSPEDLWERFILKGMDYRREDLMPLAEDLTFMVDTQFVDRSARTEAAEVLEAIRKRDLRMGIISNVLSRRQVAFSMEQYGLEDYFDTVVLSSVVGKRKPHPEIFARACREASVDPRAVLFIGNSPIKDIGGAQKAGIGHTVLIRYEHTSAKDTGPKADYEIHDLRELVPIIDGILASQTEGAAVR